MYIMLEFCLADISSLPKLARLVICRARKVVCRARQINNVQGMVKGMGRFGI